MSSTTSEPAAGHRQRLRERFLEGGLTGFLDYEVVELLLTLGTPRRDCKPMAKELMNRFVTLPAVLEADPALLKEIRGVGPVNIFGLKLIKAVAGRYLEQKLANRVVVSNSQTLFDFLNLRLRDKTREHFMVLFLTAKNHIITARTLFKGTLTASAVYPREVVREALNQNAAAVIFAHNHPSGDPAPSPEDIRLTEKLALALNTLDIVVHEHLIVGDGRYYSFVDAGVMRRIHETTAKWNRFGSA